MALGDVRADFNRLLWLWQVRQLEPVGLVSRRAALDDPHDAFGTCGVSKVGCSVIGLAW